MPTTLWAANADEIDDLIIWLDNHPDEVDPLSRDAVAQWLVEFLRKAEAFPSSAAVPEGAVDVLDALIEDWTEVLTAHDEGFLTELKKLRNEAS
jgi:hypothetical protein